MRKQKIVLLIILLSILVSKVSATDYKLYQIGKPEGASPGSMSLGISNSGTVLCCWWADGINDTTGAAIWNKNTGVDVISSKNGIYNASSLNNLDQVVVSVFDKTSYTCKTQIRNPDGTLISFPNGVSGGAINDVGDILESTTSIDSSNNLMTSLIRWDASGHSDTIFTSTTNNGVSEEVYSSVGINNSGFVAWSKALTERTELSYKQTIQSYIWNGVTSRLLNPLNADDNCYARGMNDSGFVVGQSGGHAILWDVEGNATDLGSGIALGINNHNQIVGTLEGKGGVLWNPDGSIVYLDSYSGDAKSTPIAINDFGQITGNLHWENATPMAAMWEPVPEPSSILALICGLGSLTAFKIRRKDNFRT